MFYDLNVPWVPNDPELPRTLSFLSERYTTVALTHTIEGKIPSGVACAIPHPLPIPTPPRLKILRRCNVITSDPSQNPRLSLLQPYYDILALCPTTAKALQQAAESLDCDLISIDLTTRFETHFKFSTLGAAIERGVRFEINYAGGILGDQNARRNLIGNAQQLIRATRCRGLVISSGAKRALACRGPFDVVNLACVWGMSQEVAREAVGHEARQVVMQGMMKRRSYRGVVDVVYGGKKPERKNENKKEAEKKAEASDAPSNTHKRKSESHGGTPEEADREGKPLSNRELKRRAKKARLNSTALDDRDHSRP